MTAAVFAAAGLSACSAHRESGPQTVTLAHDLTVTLPQGAKAAAEPEPTATRSLGTYHSLIKILAPAERVSVTRPAVVAFPPRIPPRTLPPLPPPPPPADG